MAGNAQQQSRLKELIARGKEQGYLTYAEVNDHLPEDIADPERVKRVLAEVGCADPDAFLERSLGADNKALLRERNDEAVAAGIFGSPSFIVDGELFWGDDRLEDALAHVLVI